MFHACMHAYFHLTGTLLYVARKHLYTLVYSLIHRTKMNLQISLRNEPVKPWSDECCEACWFATKERCTCRCGGKYHGVGHPHVKYSEDDEVITDGADVARFSEECQEKVCRWCEASLLEQPFKHYGPHSGGWTLRGYEEKRWVYVTCPKCGYDWAIWKLGAPRE